MNLLLSILKAVGIMIGFVAVVATIKKYISEPIFKRIFSEKHYKKLQGLFTFIVQVMLYFCIRRYAFGLPALSGGTFSFFLIGAALGSIMIVASILILKGLNAYSFEKNDEFSSSSISNTITAAVFFLLLALFEEIAVRGILYTGLRSSFGLVGTVAITTIIFVVPHLKNKGITVYSVISLILAGVILNLLREYSGDIWMPFGFHFAWNFLQGIIGFNVSGDNEMISIYRVTPKNKKYLNGGEFGTEASVVTIIIIIVSILGLILLMYF